MRGYGLSLGIGGALYLLLYFTPIGIATGFFGGILLTALTLPFRSLEGQTGYVIATFGPPAAALALHLICYRRERLFKDSPLTIAATTWLAFAVCTLHFLCQFGLKCSGPWPFV